MISVEDINLKFVQANTSVSEVVAVKVQCPNCDFEVKKSVMNQGVREVQWCRNLDCDTEEFEVNEDRMIEFYLKHNVRKAGVEKKTDEVDTE